MIVLLAAATIIAIIVYYKNRQEKDEKPVSEATSQSCSVPCELEFQDDLANKGCKLAEDVDNKLLQELEDSNAANLEEDKMPIGAVKGKYRSRIFLHIGDITTLGVDAIVNAANQECIGGGGIDGAIHKACGKEALKKRVLKYLKPNSKGIRCPTGTARVISVVGFPKTCTLNKNIKFILQAVGPVKTSVPMLRSTYQSALNNAKMLGIRHVAFNCISTGIYGFPLDLAADTAVKTVREWMEANEDSELQVVFVLFKKGDFALQLPEYQKAIAKYFPFDQ